MKRWLLILIAIMLLFVVACKKQEQEEEVTPPPAPEEPEYEPLPEEYKSIGERIEGEWYTEDEGLLITLVLKEDGDYEFSIPGNDPEIGKWEVEDSQVVLGGDKENVLELIGDTIRYDVLDLIFTREKPETYVPADILSDAKEGAFDGFYRSQFVAVGDGTIFATAMEEDSFIYIEGTNVALGGSTFGNVIKVFNAAPGALTISEEGLDVRLELQEDGFLRMTVSAPVERVVYLMPSVIPGTEPEAP